ncbi:potassium-transporting ATPase subunit KdpC [Cupriavidus oxalaticus]|jgi:K+-transporting ATPase ATPase C chain|uniref:Potassium-transporting ATPase KdpC subunit n=1 Tax=Cupriavidus oxalaticus TaxID=96344 RepID=A0A375GLF3_9BURK|nr:potassium-transporting ATPase subunit KdpC [Cupriavidus oxalaticus]QEZ43879.1 potassium-transporting ATPase subunit KdpC [Cupriavidus oxalaticus]QRQ84712.1 potassium-transporting ATPase subunit KdpC [Cupriavidus oxalaticus]QRQ91199.1 potassium-transporting ATPase subunit KdpC [Cupriavidus oxalaticus]WQD85755.1 potassium-transporting ATPase subunit KdpC [Cupriavidus oxalaticus]SPC05041.1 P-type ATPase, high-affinity potassium transport system, C chain [Cupriavidus oxalaticus]
MNTDAYSQQPSSQPLSAPLQAGLVRPMVVLFVALSLMTGLLYPGVITGIAKAVFPHQAGGSLLEKDGKTMGSELIGQPFSDPKYFWGRLSATTPMPYNASASSGSNLGPSNPSLADAARARIEALHAADPGNHAPVPVDLVTSSASGLDPQISPAAAEYQAARVARVRGFALEQVRALIAAHTEKPLLPVLGDPGVNVLKLNLALDSVAPQR